MLRAPNVGVKDFKDHVSEYINKANTIVITHRGEPTSVVFPYEEALELIDMLDELQDQKTLAIISDDQNAMNRGDNGRMTSKVFEKYRAK